MSWERVYVAVRLEFDTDGRMRPCEMQWQDGRRWPIDRVLEVRPAAAQKSGGQGDRYRVCICGKERSLFFEHSTGKDSVSPGRWFVEAEIAEESPKKDGKQENDIKTAFA